MKSRRDALCNAGILPAFFGFKGVADWKPALRQRSNGFFISLLGWEDLFPDNGLRFGENRGENLIRKERVMLWTIAAILLACWLLGVVSFHVLGAYVHILLLLAIIAILIRVIQGRNPL